VNSFSHRLRERVTERKTSQSCISPAQRSWTHKANAHCGSAFQRARASQEAYAVACIELFSRLWVELEALVATDDHRLTASGTPAPRVQVLRLELILLLDACQSARWRAQLDSIQRLSLQSILHAILHVLNAWSEGEILWGIESAQNRLLDAIKGQCATLNTTERSNRHADL
jgi:hypothetical protein